MSAIPQELQGADYDPQEHNGCYVFTPASTESQRPPKRRRTNAASGKGKQRQKSGDTQVAVETETEENKCLFPPLFEGKEDPEAVRSRWETYLRLWKEQEERTNGILASVNERTLREVAEFARKATPASYDNKLPTALILTGPNIASHGPLFEQIATRIYHEEGIGPVVVLSSKDATNLKNTLKKLIKDATQESQGLDDEDDIGPTTTSAQKGTKLLNYDLQILQNWCKQHESSKVAIAIQDTEAFDSVILADLISLLSAYLNRIPFILLLGIATSVDIFHEKLPKSIIRLMRGEKFDVARAEECLAKICNDATIGTESILRLGPTLCNFLLGRHRDHTQSIQVFVAALKYAYMSHFYANPLSVALGYLDEPDKLHKVLQKEHIQAIRNLPSFRRFIESKLEDEDTQEIRALLDDDEYLLSIIPTACGEAQSYAVGLAQCLQVLELARSCTTSQSRIPRHDLYPKALLGELGGSSTVRELLLTMKKMNSTKFLALLDKVLSEVFVPYLQDRLPPLRDEISGLVEDSTKKNLVSEFDLSNVDTLRATVVSRRVQLSEKKSSLTKEEEEYSKLVQQVHDEFEKYFTRNLKGVREVLLHELFFYDLISPHRDVFAPKQRFTIERALSNPQDYLPCECCVDENMDADEIEKARQDGEESTIHATSPPASILYKLYLESGALINIYDLWTAFYAIIGGSNVGDEGEGEGENEDEDDPAEDSGEKNKNKSNEGAIQPKPSKIDKPTAQALFYRALAELRFLGFVKASKRKTDHLAKLAWKGL